MRLPKSTAEEERRREAAMEEGLKSAVRVPLSLAEAGVALWPWMGRLARAGNVNTKSDLQVGLRNGEEIISVGFRYLRKNLRWDEHRRFIKM